MLQPISASSLSDMEQRDGPGHPRSIDPVERIDLLARDLRSSLDGLSSREGIGANYCADRQGKDANCGVHPG